ncbi:hypothetical protein DPMN_180771 [Dreissena polymorpha]|uniref:Uncharacterized protein n=1 Tax=Dreissena polymorpha TaxID=45954 RepID=A0A9D4I351_DREPO|nr:hypothetical protein DPMN_180771 [Dreissena polymorpha]
MLAYITQETVTLCGVLHAMEDLRNWEVHDDPWTEHCRWYPSCRFAREVKGNAFIENIQQQVRHQNQLTETSNQQYRYPEQAKIEARLATFDKIPNRFPINVDDLAQAGLFYTGWIIKYEPNKCNDSREYTSKGNNHVPSMQML